MRPPCQPPTALSRGFRAALRTGRRPSTYSRSVRLVAAGAGAAAVPLHVDQPGRLDRGAATSAGSCSTTSRDDLVLEPRVEVPHPVAGVQADQQVATGTQRPDQCGDRLRAARRPRGGSASTTRGRRPSRRRPAAASARAGPRPGSRAVWVPLAGLARPSPATGRGRWRPRRRRRGTPWCGRVRSRPRRRGAPPRARPRGSSSHCSSGRSPLHSSARWSAYAAATASYDARTRASRASRSVGQHALPVGRPPPAPAGGRVARRRPRPRPRACAPSGCPSARAGGAARAPAVPPGRPGAARHASTASRSAKACSRSAWVRSAPAGCGPRSSSTVSSARSSSARPSRSPSSWWYFSVRRPVAAQTTRTSSRSRSRLHDRLDGRLVVVDHRVTRARLVAGGAQGAERERVRRRDGHLLLQQGAQHPLLLGVQVGQGLRRHHAPTLAADQPSGRGCAGPARRMHLHAGEASPPHCPGDPGPDRATARRSPGPAGRRRPRRPRPRPCAGGVSRSCRRRPAPARPRWCRRRSRSCAARRGPGAWWSPSRAGSRSGPPPPGWPACSASRSGARSATPCAASAASAPRPGSSSSPPACCCAASSATPSCPASAPWSSTRCTSGSSTPTSPWPCCSTSAPRLREDLLLVAMSATVEAERHRRARRRRHAGPGRRRARRAAPGRRGVVPAARPASAARDERGVTPAFLDHVAAVRAPGAGRAGRRRAGLPARRGRGRRRSSAGWRGRRGRRRAAAARPALPRRAGPRAAAGPRRRVVVSTAVAESSLTVPGRAGRRRRRAVPRAAHRPPPRPRRAGHRAR